MKKIVCLILCCALLFSLVACDNGADTDSSSKASSINVNSTSDNTSSESTSSSFVVPTTNNYEEITYPLAETTDYFHVTGRTEVTTSSLETGELPGLLCDHPAQGLRFSADCEGDVTLTLSINAKGASTKRFFTPYIDGVKQEIISTSVVPGGDAILKIKIASNLPKGKHLIEVFRNQEGYYGTATLLSVTMKGVPEKWVEDEGTMKIEVLGDSLVCGNGITASKGAPDENEVQHTNAVLANPFVACRSVFRTKSKRRYYERISLRYRV